MTEKASFEKLPEDRREQILRIAAEAFVRGGYEGASTNEITRRAGISKGILFHYFGNKKELYLYLLNGCARRFAEAVEEQAAAIGGLDLYGSMAALFKAKADYLRRYPLDMELMERSHQERSPEVAADIRRALAGLAAAMMRQRADIAARSLERAPLRPGLTREQALECILLSLDALDARFAALYRLKGPEVIQNPDVVLNTMRLYLDVVGRGLFEDVAQTGFDNKNAL